MDLQASGCFLPSELLLVLFPKDATVDLLVGGCFLPAELLLVLLPVFFSLLELVHEILSVEGTLTS